MQEAFSLVEVVLALGVFVFAVVSIAGLFSVGINTSKESSDQMQAANFVSLLVSTRRALPTNTISNFALPPLNAAFSNSGTYVMGVAVDGTVTGPPAYNLFYQAGTNAATGPQMAQVHLMVWWPPASGTNNSANRCELTTQIALP